MPRSTCLEIARNTHSSPAQLEDLTYYPDPDVQVAVAANPSTPPSAVEALLRATVADPLALDVSLLGQLVDAVLVNPSLPLWLLTQPDWLERQPAQVTDEMACSKALTPWAWRALRGNNRLRTKANLLESAVAPPDAWTQLGLPIEGALAIAPDSHSVADEPARSVIVLVGRAPRTNITSFELTSVALGDNGVKKLAQATSFSKLRELDLSANNIGNEGAMALAQSTAFPELRALNLHFNRLGRPGVRALARSATFPKLTVLSLSGNDLVDGALVALAQSTAFPELTELDLRDNAVGDIGVTALARSNAFPRLKKLSLAVTRIEDEGVVALAHSNAFPELRELRLERNRLGNKGVVALAHSNAFPKLTELTLAHSWVGDEGVAALAHSNTFPELISLALGCDERDEEGVEDEGMGDDGVIALARSTAFPKLASLELGGSRIGERGILALAVSPLLATLSRLYVEDVRVEDEVGEVLREAIARFPGLELHGPLAQPIVR